MQIGPGDFFNAVNLTEPGDVQAQLGDLALATGEAVGEDFPADTYLANVHLFPNGEKRPENNDANDNGSNTDMAKAHEWSADGRAAFAFAPGLGKQGITLCYRFLFHAAASRCATRMRALRARGLSAIS